MRPAIYEIHVQGLIAEQDLVEFVGMSSRTERDGTVLTGPVADQPALAGIVARVEALGCQVTSFTTVSADDAEQTGHTG